MSDDNETVVLKERYKDLQALYTHFKLSFHLAAKFNAITIEESLSLFGP